MRNEIEVVAFCKRKSDNRLRVIERRVYISVCSAMMRAMTLAEHYPRVEVADILIDDDNRTIAEDKTIAIWENGFKTF